MKKNESFENRIITLIFTASRNIRQESQENETDITKRLSMIQLETLKFIRERENSSMKDVADHLSIAPPSLTPLIDCLEQKKLIRRGSSKNDRRVTLIHLTDEGKDTLEKTMKRKMKKMSNIFKKLTKEERESLIRILEKLSVSK